MNNVKFFILFVIVIISFSIITTILYYQTETEIIATVTDKSITVIGHEEETETIYLIFTDKEVFENSDMIFKGKFNSSDFYSNIKIGKTYKFKVYGWRIPILSSYRNIYTYQEKL